MRMLLIIIGIITYTILVNPVGAVCTANTATVYTNIQGAQVTIFAPDGMGTKFLQTGDSWDIGNGYKLEILAIDARTSPRNVWFNFSNYGNNLDEKILTEGQNYSYSNIFSAHIDSISGGVKFSNIYIFSNPSPFSKTYTGTASGQSGNQWYWNQDISQDIKSSWTVFYGDIEGYETPVREAKATDTGKNCIEFTGNYKGGDITVISNLNSASFIVSGSGGYIKRANGTSWNDYNVKGGSYSVTFIEVSGYRTPSSQIKTVSPGSMVIFNANYAEIIDDKILPAISISSPNNGQTFNASAITVNGAASDNVALSKVEIKVGNGNWLLASGTNSWSAQVTLSQGSNTITARTTDNSGNIVEKTVTVTYKPPDKVPLISIFFPSNGQNVTTDTINVSGISSDDIGVNKVEVKVGTEAWLLASGTNSWSAQVTLSQGSNTITARATDNSRNIVEQTVTVTYKPPDEVPTISIYSPSNDQTVATNTINVSGISSDDIGLNKVEVKVGTEAWLVASGTNSWSALVTLSEGPNKITARATDTSGNTNFTTVTLTYAPQHWWIIILAIVILIIAYLWIKGNLKLVPRQTSVICDGKSTLQIKVQFVNIFGKLKKQRKDREVEMETTSGKIQKVVIPAGKEFAEAILTSSNECGPVSVTAKSGSQKAIVIVNFISRETGIEVIIGKSEIPPDGKSTAQVTVKVKDEYGNFITYLNEKTIDISTTLGTIISPVKIPPKSLEGKTTLTSGQISGTSIVTAISGSLKGEGRIVFKEAKRYCVYCGSTKAIGVNCPVCGKLDPTGGPDTRTCKNCPEVMPVEAKFCSACGARQPD